MKSIISIFVLLFSFTVFGQISVGDLIKIAKMDSESFEIFILGKGYGFDASKDEEDVQGLRYFKWGGYNGSERYITHYTKFFNDKFHANYQTAYTSELLGVYKELKVLGFELSLTERNVGEFDLSKTYYKRSNSTIEEVVVFVTSDWIEIGYGYSEIE
ncbi:MAG: hypothetical protein ACPG21_12225 [Crocinitomicaceae bacterium]